MGKVLAILEVSQKQDYIFARKELWENAARSGDIAFVTGNAFFQEAAAALYQKEKNLVYSGGGHTVLQFDGQDQATAFAKCVTEAVLRRYEGLELFVKQMPYDSARTPEENLKELSIRLERKKAQRKAGFRQLSFGVEALNDESFSPQGSRIRRTRQNEGMDPPEGWEYPTKFEKLAGKDNFIAVIHIDGNAMGKRVDRVYRRFGQDWESCRAGLQRFSQSIQRDFEQAFLEMADEVTRRFPKLAPTLPVRPVILAGDDVCFVSAGNIGLECARIFLERLSAKTNAGDQENYSACAGVALVHTKFPFHRAYDLAEELCASAKRFGAALDPDGRVSAMDWHIEFGQMKDDLAELREDYACEDGSRMELRPVAVIVPDGCGDPDVRDYAFFKSLCLAVQKKSGNIARSKIKELRQAFKQGRLESEYFLHDKQIGALLYHAFEAEYRSPDQRWDRFKDLIHRREDIQKSAFREIGGVGRCLYFDAIEMADHFTAFEEVDA